jgi:hypothetical protein
MPITFSETDTVLGSKQPEVRIETDAERLTCQDEVGVDINNDVYKSSGSGDEGGKDLGRSKNNKREKLGTGNQRKWLKIDAEGESYITGSATLRTVSKLGIQPRDLRFLELHAVSYSPPALLARENAIVVSFECIRCIITLTYVLVINPTDERVTSLIEDLKAQLVGQEHKMRFPGESKLSDVASKLKFGRSAAVELPFELKALEICFDKVNRLSACDLNLKDASASDQTPLNNHFADRFRA